MSNVFSVFRDLFSEEHVLIGCTNDDPKWVSDDVHHIYFDPTLESGLHA